MKIPEATALEFLNAAKALHPDLSLDWRYADSYSMIEIYAYTYMGPSDVMYRIKPRSGGEVRCADLQKMLHRTFFEKGSRYQAINTFALASYQNNYESDFLAVTKTGRVHEVEIKLTKADFKKDFEKHCESRFWSSSSPKHTILQDGKWANYFWFCGPESVIDVDMVPPQYGVLVLRDGYKWLHEIRRPKLLRRDPAATPEVMRKMAQSMMMRLFKEMDTRL